MKRFYFLYILSVLYLISFTACMDEVVESYTVADEVYNRIVITADDLKVDKDSRTTLTITDRGAEFAWAENDTIGIFPTEGAQAYFPMVSGAGTNTATFTGGGWALKQSFTYAAYFPYDYGHRDCKNISLSYMGQVQQKNADTSHISSYDYMAAVASSPYHGEVFFDFKHLGALLQFKLVVPADATLTSLSLMLEDNDFVQKGKINLLNDPISVIPVERGNSLELGLADIDVQKGKEVTLYMMVAPTNLSGKKLTVSVSDNKGNVAQTELNGKNFEAGIAYSLSGTLSEFTEAVVQITGTKGKVVGAEGGLVEVEYLSQLSCEVVIPDDARSWIKKTSSRALISQSIFLEVEENTGESNRRATVIIKNSKTNLAVEYNILQAGCNSYAITENGRLPIGVLSAQYPTENTVQSLSYLLDNNMDTYYEVNKTNIHFIWEGPDAVAAKSFGCSMAYEGDYHPNSFHIEKSSNGKTWNGLGWGIIIGGEDKIHSVQYGSGVAVSQFFMFKFEGSHGGSTTQVAEIFLEQTDVSINSFEDLVKLGSGSSYSSQTPMGRHYENRHVTTDSDRNWLATASNEPDLLPSASGYTLRPYAVNLYPFGEPIPADINQHGIGDCSALAVLAELAYRFPDFIKSIITNHGDGTFTVAMYDPQGKSVKVRVQSTFLGDNNGIGASSGKNGEANWATVMEKAIMKWNKIYQVNPDISGIGSEHVAPLFTGEGNSFAIAPNNLIGIQLKQAANLSFANNMIVIGGFTQGNVDTGNGAQTVTAHAFSFMQSTDSRALFSMRNPWGNSPGGTSSDDGVLNIMDDGIVPPLIDMRIIYPGAAEPYAKPLYPYVPPIY